MGGGGVLPCVSITPGHSHTVIYHEPLLNAFRELYYDEFTFFVAYHISSDLSHLVLPE